MSATTIEDRMREEARLRGPLADKDEVWDGEYLVSPNPDWDHQDLALRFILAFAQSVDLGAGAHVFAGLNVSDRMDGWHQNYRIPDVLVILRGGRARNCGTHVCGGPDIVVEILSRNDRAREKQAFYASIAVRESWILDRSPWALERYRLEGGTLVLAGVSKPGDAEVNWSEVLPVGFRLVEGEGRPEVEVVRRDADEGRRI